MNTMLNRITLSLALPLALIGCATTQMTSMAAPEVKGRSFGTVLVIADIADLGLRQQAENAFAHSPSTAHSLVCDPICRAADDARASTVFLAAYAVLFPGRNYTPMELIAILAANKIDATLVVTPTAAGTSESYVPPSYSTSCTSWSVTTSCRTTQSGGVVVERPRATYVARMFEIRSGRAIWISTASTGGNAFASSSTLIESMAEKTLQHLRSDGVVR